MWGITRQREVFKVFFLLRNEIQGMIHGSRNCSSAIPEEFLGRTIDVQFKSPSKAESIDESASKKENDLQEQAEE